MRQCQGVRVCESVRVSKDVVFVLPPSLLRENSIRYMDFAVRVLARTMLPRPLLGITLEVVVLKGTHKGCPDLSLGAVPHHVQPLIFQGPVGRSVESFLTSPSAASVKHLGVLSSGGFPAAFVRPHLYPPGESQMLGEVIIVYSHVPFH